MAEFSTVARPYAKALFDLASAQRKLAEWSAALGAAGAVVADAGAKRTLAAPTLDDKQRAELVGSVASAADHSASLRCALARSNNAFA